MKLLLFLLILLQFGSSQNHFQVTLDNVKGKSEYYLSESIYIKLSIVNKTEYLLEFKAEYLSKQFYLKDKRGSFLEPYILFSNETHYRIFPADSFVVYWDIATAFNQSYKVEGLEHGLPVDQYTIYYMFENDSLHLESNHFSFRVLPPPDAEKKAFNLYSKARKIFWDSDNKKRSQMAKTLVSLEVVEKYPQSVYAPSALYLAQITGEDREKLGMRLINQYPFAPEIWNLLISIKNRYRVKRDKSGVESFLTEIISRHPNTFAGKEAQRRLMKIQSLSLEEWLNPDLATKRKLKEYREKQH